MVPMLLRMSPEVSLRMLLSFLSKMRACSSLGARGRDGEGGLN